MIAKHIGSFLRQIGVIFYAWLPDGIALSGGACLVYGASLLHPVAAWVTSGVLLLATAVIFSKGRGEPK